MSPMYRTGAHAAMRPVGVEGPAASSSPVPMTGTMACQPGKGVSSVKAIVA
jgi:hypothetical protein